MTPTPKKPDTDEHAAEVEEVEEINRKDRALEENQPERLDEKLEEALEETFPASDPVSVTVTNGTED